MPFWIYLACYWEHQQAGTVLYTRPEQPCVQVLPEIYLNSLQYPITLSTMSVDSPLGFTLIGTQRKTWGRTSAGIPTTIPVVRGATPLTPTCAPRSAAYHSVQRVRPCQTASLGSAIWLKKITHLKRCQMPFQHVFSELEKSPSVLNKSWLGSVFTCEVRVGVRVGVRVRVSTSFARRSDVNTANTSVVYFPLAVTSVFCIHCR